MGCRCKERGEAIVRGALAIASGDTATARDAAAYVARTAIDDAALAARQARAAAMAKLKGRRWG